MFNYLPLQWLFLFYFYCFFGWCFESTYVSILQKHPVNRGFMQGPFLPLYGSGGIMMLVLSKPFYDNIFLVYLAGCIGATVLEYVTGVTMESLFKVRYWDYSHKFLNYKGHICLESTLFWGVLTVVFTRFLQVPIEHALLSIPYNILSVITMIITVYFSCDFMVAFKIALDLRDVLIYMEKAKGEMQRMQKRLDVIIAFKGEEVKEGLEDVKDGIISTVDGISEKAADLGDMALNLGSGITGGISERLDALSDALESSFAKVKDKVSVSSDHMDNFRDEITELYAKYRIIKDRMTPKPIKNFFDWYRTRTILDNPTMVSEKFKSSLDEMRERAEKLTRRNKDK